MRTSIRVIAARSTALLTAAAFVAGCSTASKDITATYVSPAQFQAYDCTQLTAETQRLQARYVELGGRLDQAATNDKTIMGVGLILFWPALFALGGTKSQEAEYGRLRGEYDAVQQTLIQKRCAAGNPLLAGTAPGTPVATGAPTAIGATAVTPAPIAVASAQPAASTPLPVDAAASAVR